MQVAKFDSGSWPADLLAVRSGELDFDALIKRHNRLIVRMIEAWCRVASPDGDWQDLLQEARLTIWRAIRAWEAERGVPIQAYVRRQVHYRMLEHTRIFKTRERLQKRYIQYQIIAETVIRPVYARFEAEEHFEENTPYIAVQPAESDCAQDTVRDAYRLIGTLRSDHARVVIHLMRGGTGKTAARSVYGSTDTRSRRAAFRAIAAAHALVVSSQAQER